MMAKSTNGGRELAYGGGRKWRGRRPVVVSSPAMVRSATGGGELACVGKMIWGSLGKRGKC